jgi:hypothetical protein
MAELAAKPSDRDIQIYTAGTVPFPPNYPAVGILDQTATFLGEDVVQIEYSDAPGQVCRYLIRREDITAIRFAQNGVLERTSDEWLFSAQVREKKALTKSTDGLSYGIVYVREGVGVIRQVERAMTAGEIAAMGCPCEGKNDKDGCEG